eukprot:gene2131-1997_t
MAEQLKASWQVICDLPVKDDVEPLDQFADTFYDKLWTTTPSYREGMFKNVTVRTQGRKLTKVLDMIVKSAEDLDKVMDQVVKLGKRHVNYGVFTKEQYMDVANALLYTLEKHSGDAWNDEIKQIWTDTYVTLMNIMIDAAKEKMEKDEKK